MEDLNFIKGRISEIIQRPGGKVDAIAQVATGGDVSEAQVKQTLSEVYGVSQNQIHPMQRARRRGSVAFSSKNWNSSWVPDGTNPADIDPTQN